MSPRDNTDQIPIDNLRIDGAGLNLRWRRKDKLRSATIVGEFLRVEFEEVAWGDGDEFALLWVVAGGVVRPLYPMRWSEAEHIRTVPVGAGVKDEYRIDVPLSVPNMPVVGRYGLLFATPTVRSAIRAYEMERRQQPPETEEPTVADNLIESVRAVRAMYPERITDNDAGAIVNAVAWRHRHDGWGVARKTQGARASQPRTGTWISRDILIHAPSQRMYDVLSNVSGGVGTPVWNDAGPQDMEFVAPAMPDDVLPPPVEPPAPPPRPPIDDEYVTRAELADWLAALSRMVDPG